MQMASTVKHLHLVELPKATSTVCYDYFYLCTETCISTKLLTQSWGRETVMPFKGNIFRPHICGGRIASSIIRGRGARLLHPIVLSSTKLVSYSCMWGNLSQVLPVPLPHFTLHWQLHTLLSTTCSNQACITHTDKGWEADKILHDILIACSALLWNLDKMPEYADKGTFIVF